MSESITGEKFYRHVQNQDYSDAALLINQLQEQDYEYITKSIANDAPELEDLIESFAIIYGIAPPKCHFHRLFLAFFPTIDLQKAVMSQFHFELKTESGEVNFQILKDCFPSMTDDELGQILDIPERLQEFREWIICEEDLNVTVNVFHRILKVNPDEIVKLFDYYFEFDTYELRSFDRKKNFLALPAGLEFVCEFFRSLDPQRSDFTWHTYHFLFFIDLFPIDISKKIVKGAQSAIEHIYLNEKNLIRQFKGSKEALDLYHQIRWDE